MQLVPAAAWTAPKSKRGAGFIHTSKQRDIRQILTVKHHHGFCAGESLKIGCHQDLGWGYKQIYSFISQKGLSMNLHATLRDVRCFRGKFETWVWGKRSFFVLLSSSRHQVSALCLHIVICAETEILPQLSQPAAKEQTRIILTKQGLVKTMSWYFLSTWKKRGKCACGCLCVCVLCLTVSAIVEQCFSCVLVKILQLQACKLSREHLIP